VLSLGGAAISAGAGHGGVTGLMAGAVLIMLAAFSPWALLRLVPLAEVAAGAAGSLRGELRPSGASANQALGLAMRGDEALTRLAARMAHDDPGTDDVGDTTRPATSRSPAPASGPSVDPPVESDASGTEEPADTPDETPAADEQPWSERSVLELGPGFGSTPVWPHPDAE
jgi:hypothetical protein